MQDNLQHKYQIIAGMHNYSDFLELLQLLVADISDVRVNIGDGDSIDSRKLMAKYLEDVIDTIQRIRNNEIERLGTPSQKDELT